MTQIKFGTDGWRAVIAEHFTFQNVARVAQATADYWRAHPVRGQRNKAVVGYDRRFLSEQFARCTAEVLCGNGFEVLLTPVPTPTPAVSLAVRDSGAAGGVMITASHNPPQFNGYKLKSHFGGAADAVICAGVESFLDRQPVRAMRLEDALQRRLARLTDLRPAHYRTVKKLVDFKLVAQSKLRFAHDALFGVGAGCFEELLVGTTCRVTTLNDRHDVMFGGINPEPIPANYAPAAAFLRRHPHDFCLVTDGDADRVGGMDGRGRPLTTHQMICLLLHHLLVNRQSRGRIVKSLTTTSMVDKICAKHGLPLTETSVGFKHIGREMIRGGVLLGGEESGGIGFAGHIPERDGILAGLIILELLATERKTINRLAANLEREFGPHRYARRDVRFPLEKRAALMEFCQTNPPAKLLGSPVARLENFDGVKYVARDTSWLMLRGSGTEPFLRIYAEARSDAAAQKLLQLGLRLTKQVK